MLLVGVSRPHVPQVKGCPDSIYKQHHIEETSRACTCRVTKKSETSGDGIPKKQPNKGGTFADCICDVVSTHLNSLVPSLHSQLFFACCKKSGREPGQIRHMKCVISAERVCGFVECSYLAAPLEISVMRLISQ